MPPPAHHSPTPDDVAIAAAVEQLLADRGETVVDLAHFTRISVSSLYRKLAGQQSWKASDVGAIARHWQVDPGLLYRPLTAPEAPGRPAPGQPSPAPAADHLLRPFSSAR